MARWPGGKTNCYLPMAALGVQLANCSVLSDASGDGRGSGHAQMPLHAPRQIGETKFGDCSRTSASTSSMFLTSSMPVTPPRQTRTASGDAAPTVHASVATTMTLWDRTCAADAARFQGVGSFSHNSGLATWFDAFAVDDVSRRWHRVERQ